MATLTLRKLHIVTERPKTEPKPTPSVLKNGKPMSGFLPVSVSVWGFGRTVISLSYDRRERERDGVREGGTEGERGRDTQRQREGGREILTAEEKKILLPPCESERVAEGRARGGEREMDEGTGGERESKGEGGREILTAEEKKISSSAPRERVGGGREGGRGKERGWRKGGREGGERERDEGIGGRETKTEREVGTEGERERTREGGGETETQREEGTKGEGERAREGGREGERERAREGERERGRERKGEREGEREREGGRERKRE